MAASELRAVINPMLHLHRELQEVRKARAKQLGLNEEALAFYEAVAGHLRQAVRGLGANQRDNVLLGSPLDAAMADPRWRARETLARAGTS